MSKLERQIPRDDEYGHTEALTLKWDDEARGFPLTVECPDNTYLDFFALSRNNARDLYEFLRIVFDESQYEPEYCGV